MLISKLKDFLVWLDKKFKYDPVEAYLSKSVDRADYVARFKHLRHRGLL